MMKPPFKRNGVAAQLEGRNLDEESYSALVEQSRAFLRPKITLNYDCSPEDIKAIHAIVARIKDMFETMDSKAAKGFEPVLCAMDIATVHCNGTPLKLTQLLMSANEDFTHDVLGIGVHIDRTNGQLKNGFVPRFKVESN